MTLHTPTLKATAALADPTTFGVIEVRQDRIICANLLSEGHPIFGIRAADPTPLAILQPIRNTALFQWCLAQGLRVVRPAALTSGAYCAEPDGACPPPVVC